MGLFVYTQKGSIISMVDLPTTEIIEPAQEPIDLSNPDVKALRLDA
jgi:hypothetical protein